jgi:protein-S-isoprenylcysteine O-methyltransferase Ste14
MRSMNTKKYPYIYDLIAGILTLFIIILSNTLQRGENVYLRIIGVSILIQAGIIGTLPFIYLKKYGKVDKGKKYYQTECVVDRGIYGIIRHPQYLAYIFLVIGFTLIAQNWIIYLIALLAISLFHFHTVKEEEDLINKFQDDYINYCKRIPRYNIILGLIKRLQKS